MPQIELKLLDGRTSPERVSMTIAGGILVAYTGPAPDKVGDNEDTVAAIPYGPDAAVLVIADGAGGLPGARRLMDEFEIRSKVGKGTRIIARMWKPCTLEL